MRFRIPYVRPSLPFPLLPIPSFLSRFPPPLYTLFIIIVIIVTKKNDEKLTKTKQSDLSKVTPDNLVVFSVRYHTPWKRVTSYDVPADMPGCPEGGACGFSTSLGSLGSWLTLLPFVPPRSLAHSLLEIIRNDHFILVRRRKRKRDVKNRNSAHSNSKQWEHLFWRALIIVAI